MACRKTSTYSVLYKRVRSIFEAQVGHVLVRCKRGSINEDLLPKLSRFPLDPLSSVITKARHKKQQQTASGTVVHGV